MLDPLEVFDAALFSPLDLVDAFCASVGPLDLVVNVTAVQSRLAQATTSLDHYGALVATDADRAARGLVKMTQSLAADGPTRLAYAATRAGHAARKVDALAEEVDVPQSGEGPVAELVKMRRARSRLAHVARLFETARFVATLSEEGSEQTKLAPTGGSDDSKAQGVSYGVFCESLAVLEDLLEEGGEIGGKLETLEGLQGFFKGLGPFETEYERFVSRLESFKKAQSSKQVENERADQPEEGTSERKGDANREQEKKPAPIEKDPQKPAQDASSGGFGFMNFFNKI